VFAVIVAALLLGPELYAIVVRAAEGRMVSPPVLWRSSAPGVDLLTFLLPNPNHPLAPRALVDWVAHQPGQFEENVMSIPWTALIVLFAAWRWAGHKARALWLGIAVFFASLALGPFVRVAGSVTYVPTPWTFLRYLPLIGEARMPPRFGVLVAMAVSVLFAGAVAALVRRHPPRRRALVIGIGVALAFELTPAPRTLYSAEVPAVYHRIAADPRPVRVLELPFGIRDGLSSLGDFTAASQFYQTVHGKPLVGGYLSRVEESSKRYYRGVPMMGALMDLSEGITLQPDQEARARASADAFLAQATVGYVVMDAARVTPELRRFAVETMRLQKVEEHDGFELYTPGSPPAN
jgi:hypothetical protein